MKLLLDEMYPGALAEALRTVDIRACTALELGLAGSPDPEILAAAIEQDRALLTENVADFARISAEHLLAGGHHHGVLIALSTRFSRRPAGIGPLMAAIRAIAGEQLDDRLVYLRPAPAAH